MAVIRDVMPAFELFQPASIEDAQAVLDRYGSGAWVLAGGLDSFDWLKDRIKRPQALVDLMGIPELKGIRPWQDGLEIGSMTTLTEVVRHPVVRERYSILLEAAEAAASPQIRNQGTIGPAQDYFGGPPTNITRRTILEPGDLLTAIRLPGSWAASAAGSGGSGA